MPTTTTTPIAPIILGSRCGIINLANHLLHPTTHHRPTTSLDFIPTQLEYQNNSNKCIINKSRLLFLLDTRTRIDFSPIYTRAVGEILLFSSPFTRPVLSARIVRGDFVPIIYTQLQLNSTGDGWWVVDVDGKFLFTRHELLSLPAFLAWCRALLACSCLLLALSTQTTGREPAAVAAEG